MNQMSLFVLRLLLHGALLVGTCTVVARAQNSGSEQNHRTEGGLPSSVSNAQSSITDRLEREGVSIDFSVTATGESAKQIIAGTDALISFSLKDARTGQPLAGARPRAWLSARKTDRAPTDAECADKVRGFVEGRLSARPDIDLNSYLLLALNHDNTISVINPQISFGRTQLEHLVKLPGAGADWALSKNGETLYVTLPEQSAVAVVSTVTMQVVETISVGEKMRPTRAALQPGGRYLWVALDNSPHVAVIDTATNKLAAKIETGVGLHSFAFTPDGKFTYVANTSVDTVSAIDAQKLVKVADIPVGKTPGSIAYSSASRLVYAAAINGASISVIDPARQKVVRSIPVKRGIVAFRFEPSGRFGFAVNQMENVVEIIDASTGEVAGTVSIVKGADQIAFTGNYAYLRGTGSEKVSLIELAGIQKGKLAAVEVVAGQRPPGELPAEIGVADMIVPTPEGNSVLIANAPDQMIYYYVEGMSAPMGALSNYKRHPRAALVLDRSLTEVKPGVYSARAKLKNAGRFDVSLLLNQPRILHCFQLDVAQSSSEENPPRAAALVVKPLFEGQQFKAGESVALRFKITDSVTMQPLKGLTDVQVLAFEPPGIWQQRQFAKEVGDGEYEVSQTFPRAGQYKVMLRVASRGVAYADLPSITVTVTDK